MQLNLFDQQALPPHKKAQPGLKRRWSKDDRAHYNACKKHVTYNLNHVPCQIADQVICPVEWVKMFYPLIVSCAEREDYAGAQATKDAIVDFLNGLGANVPHDMLFGLPAYKDSGITGLICYGVEGDPSGMASGGAEFI